METARDLGQWIRAAQPGDSVVYDARVRHLGDVSPVHEFALQQALAGKITLLQRFAEPGVLQYHAVRRA